MRSLRQRLTKGVIIIGFFAVGEVLGGLAFILTMHMYDTQLSFLTPLTFVDLINYFWLAFYVLIVPLYFARMGGRVFHSLFDTHLDR